MHFRSHVAIEKCLRHVPVIHGLILTHLPREYGHFVCAATNHFDKENH